MNSAKADASIDTKSVAEEPLAVPYSPSSFKVDYQWGKHSARVSLASSPDEAAYMVALHMVRSPNLEFKRMSDGKVFATGVNKAVSINPECTIDGTHYTIQAESRLLTRYNFESHHYHPPGSSSPSPQILHWRTNMNVKKWDFTCLDKNETPIAKFHSNVWYYKKVGLLDFFEPCGDNQALREEIMVVACTMYNQMLIRINNPLNLLGAIPNPKPHKEADGLEDAKAV